MNRSNPTKDHHEHRLEKVNSHDNSTGLKQFLASMVRCSKSGGTCMVVAMTRRQGRAGFCWKDMAPVEFFESGLFNPKMFLV